MRKLEDLSDAIGRPLELDEVKLLAQPDGQMETCVVDGVQFQPVMYLAYVPDETYDQIEAGRPLNNLDFRYNGCFYVDEGRLLAVSGSLNCFVDGNYLPCRKSALLKAALAQKAKNDGRPKWGLTRDRAEQIIDKITARQQRDDHIMSLFGKKEGLGRGNDGFEKNRKRRDHGDHQRRQNNG